MASAHPSDYENLKIEPVKAIFLLARWGIGEGRRRAGNMQAGIDRETEKERRKWGEEARKEEGYIVKKLKKSIHCGTLNLGSAV